MNRKRLWICSLPLLVFLSSPTLATTKIASFSGHAQHSGGVPGVYSAGETYTAYLILDTTQDNPWYPWQVGLEYTAVVNTTVFAYFGGFAQSVDFTVADVSIYEDNGTAADYSNTATFTDGAEILTAQIQNMVGDRIDQFGLPWNVHGTLVITGGTGYGDVDPACLGGVLLNDFIDFQIQSNPPGFLEAYDAEWKCTGAVDVEEDTWSSVKALYR